MPDRLQADTELLWEEFHQLVNLPSEELRAWLLTAASDEEALPDQPGNGLPGLGVRVVELLRKRKTDLADADTETMRQVVDFVEDRTGRRPAAGAADGHWHHELMCVGHDPFKAERTG